MDETILTKEEIEQLDQVTKVVTNSRKLVVSKIFAMARNELSRFKTLQGVKL